jgi:hypothetical protein
MQKACLHKTYGSTSAGSMYYKEIIILKSTIVTDGGSLNMASTLTECVYMRTMKVIGRYQFNTYQFLSIAMPLFV